MTPLEKKNTKSKKARKIPASPPKNNNGPDPEEKNGKKEAEANNRKAGRGRGRPRQGKAVARHLSRDEEILKIAAEVLYKKGFDKARLDDIAVEAGIAKGSIYHYFGSKQEIFERLVNNVKGRINFEAEMKGDKPASERLAHLLRARLQTTVEYPLETGLLARELVRMEGPAGDWAREDPKRYLVAIRHIIIQGQKNGEFRPADPDVLASTIFGILAQLPNWYRLSSRIQPDGLVDEIIDFVMAGILADPKNKATPSSN